MRGGSSMRSTYATTCGKKLGTEITYGILTAIQPASLGKLETQMRCFWPPPLTGGYVIDRGRKRPNVQSQAAPDSLLAPTPSASMNLQDDQLVLG